MKKGLFFVLAFLVMSTSANASWFIGAKTGSMLVKFDAVDVDKDPISVSVLAGYNFSSILNGGLSAELEVTQSISPGEFTLAGSATEEFDLESQGLYVTYQSPGVFYVKGRLGLVKADISGSSLAEGEDGESYGVAIGMNHGDLAFELGYTLVDDDVGFVSIGVVYYPVR